MGKGKKMKNSGENTAGAKSKAQKKASQQLKNDARDAAKKKHEDADWAQGSNKRAAERARAQAEKQRQKEEARLAKAEARAGDEEMLNNMKKAPGKARKNAAAAKKKKGKMSAQMMRMIKEKEKADRLKREKEARANLNSTDLLATKNENKKKVEEGVLEASGIEGALSVLDVASQELKKAPKFKAAFNAFSDRETARIRTERTGLKKSQIQDMVWKLWVKSPENPRNMQTLPYNHKGGGGSTPKKKG